MTSTQTRERPPAPETGAKSVPEPGPPAPSARKVGLRSLFPYLQGYWPTLGIVAVLSLAVTLLTLSQPVLTRDVLTDIEADRPVGRLVALLVGVLIVVAVLGGVRDYLLQRAAEGLVLTARRRLVARLLRLPITEYDRRRTGDMLSRVGADTTMLRAVVTSGLFDTVTNVVMVGGSALMMCLIDPTLFAATALGLGLGVLAVVGLSRRVRGASRDAQDRIGEMTSAVERAISAVRTIRASGAEEREGHAVDGYAQEAYRAGMRIARLQAMINPITSTTIQVAFLVVLGLGGARVASGAIQVGDMVAFVLFLFMLWFPLGRALTAYSRLQSGLGALQRIEEMVDLPQETDSAAARTLTVRERTRPEPAADAGAGVPPAIEFDRVSFGYDNGETVLRDVSLTVPRGTRTALVGPSGAGKSTLLSLVERFYDATSGVVRVGGTDVRDLPRRDLRRRLGYVEQSAPVLAGTVRDNLSLAAPDATDNDMREVLRSVNLLSVIERAPLGLDTEVGEGGVLLSGGERQRLALARTFLAAPPIMLLDEATSNLDARNEALMREAIGTVTADRTLLVVAHRLSTVVDSDQIVVLEHGEVVAAGRHEELTGTSPSTGSWPATSCSSSNPHTRRGLPVISPGGPFACAVCRSAGRRQALPDTVPGQFPGGVEPYRPGPRGVVGETPVGTALAVEQQRQVHQERHHPVPLVGAFGHRHLDPRPGTGHVPEQHPELGEVEAGQVQGAARPVDQHLPAPAADHVGQHQVAVAELARGSGQFQEPEERGPVLVVEDTLGAHAVQHPPVVHRPALGRRGPPVPQPLHGRQHPGQVLGGDGRDREPVRRQHLPGEPLHDQHGALLVGGEPPWHRHRRGHRVEQVVRVDLAQALAPPVGCAHLGQRLHPVQSAPDHQGGAAAVDDLTGGEAGAHLQGQPDEVPVGGRQGGL